MTNVFWYYGVAVIGISLIIFTLFKKKALLICSHFFYPCQHLLIYVRLFYYSYLTATFTNLDYSLTLFKKIFMGI